MSEAVAVQLAPVRYLGTVKWFSDERGWGFITPYQKTPVLAERDLFLHRRALGDLDPGLLVDGARVSFSVGEHRGRPTAVAVRLES
jgi:CspA family cold shock protein